MNKITREEFIEARNQYILFRREQEKYRRIEKEIAKKMLYRETDKLLEVADYLFDIKEIEKYDDIGIEFKLTKEIINYFRI